MQALEQPTLPTNATKQIFFLPPPLNDAPNGFGKIRMFNLEPPQPDIPKYSPNENIVQYNDNNETQQGSPSLLVTILVPVASLMILLLLTFSARRIWVRHHKVTADKPITNCDLGESCPETEPLQDASMQIVQETNQNSAEINNETDEHKSITYTNEKMERRPDTLKFLAASVAFQNSTVKAFKRLPYTPDPDYMLNGDNNAHCVVINESKDNITPLTKPKTRMKPRGLLERRGSNVALTISLKAGEKPNPNPSAVKSPKPLAYLQQASCELSPNSLHTKSCDTALLQQEFWEIPMNHPSEKNFNVAGHGTKNRYKSILPNQHSRVKLPVISDNDPLSSYINANYIRKYDVTDDVIIDEVTPATRSNSAYIATQGPMANTIDDFWRMTWREAVTSVIMITKLRERKEKCSQYLPINVGESSTYDDITVTVDSLRQFEHFTVRKLSLDHKNGESRSLNHYWYTTWMDHGTPEKTRGLLELVQEVELSEPSTSGPIIVHCSAGIGRTGCYIAVTTGCQQLLRYGKVDILKIVSRMRLDRGGMIQTWEQYQFVHQALSRYARVLAGENVTTPSTSGSIRSPPEVLGKSPERPQTPKHRRSVSASSLPAPKEIKIAEPPPPPAAPKVSSPRLTDRARKNKPKLRIATAAPPLSPYDVTKPSSSPTIRSPFGRLCLHPKDPSPSPLANFKFDWPDSSSLKKPAPPGKLKLKQTDENDVKGKFPPQVRTEIPRSPLADRNNGIKTPSQKRQFAFDLPPTCSVALTNGGNDVSPSEGKTPTSGASAKSVKSAGSNDGNDRFVFPAPDKR